MGFWLGLLIGVGVSIIGIPLLIYIIYKIIETRTRRKIKRMIHNNQILKPIDPKDFDSNMWKDKIDVSKSKKELEELNDRIFKKNKFGEKEMKGGSK